MSVSVGQDKLFINRFDNDGYHYMITSINQYDIFINQFINIVADKIYEFIIDGEIKTLNCCGRNSTFLCSYLKEKIKLNYRDFDIGRLIIVDWKIKDVEIQVIQEIYGDTSGSIGRTYHELSYLKVILYEIPYHIAIETTTRPLQFYVGTDIDFDKLIRLRYQCEKFFITFSCETFYTDIAYAGGVKLKRKLKRKPKRKTISKQRSIKYSSKSIKRHPKSYPSRQAKRANFQK